MKDSMIPHPPERAEAIFAAALDLPPAEREAYIAEACGDDTALFAKVSALLAAHEAAPTDFLSSSAAEDITGDNLDLDATIDASGSGKTSGKPTGPVSGTQPATAAASPSEKPGDMIGRYKLLQEIGEGGFGTVWMAEQTEPVTRRVALKIIKLGMDTKEVIARFEAERQALAMMDDENIAKVFDAGATDRGRPFFVMELVKGMPITQYCDEAGLDTGERLALFADVCSALQHAHQKGIIHRDIKPNNVMVTLHGDKPVVKVIDFGIAKATQGKLTDKTLFTQFEQVIGTPTYMSPEQATMSGLDIDTRSDIYSLGVLLYELLTGKPPFDAKTLVSAGYEEMLRIIREDEPPKPSIRLSTVAGKERTTLAETRKIDPEKLGRLVASDLDWIVMKAIDKDRTRRYETADAFARDIGAFLADEPVSATPPSRGYQLRKFAKRNKAAIAVAAVITFLLLGGIAATSWQAIEANRARAQSDRDKEDAEAISNFLVEIFESPDLERDGRSITVAEALDSAAEKLEADLAGQPLRLAKLQFAVAKTYQSLGLYREAIPLQEKVWAYFLAAPGYGPEHPDTIYSKHQLAQCYHAVGRQDEATGMQEEMLALRRRVNGPEHPDTLTAKGVLALSYHEAGRLDEAIEMLEEVLALRRKVNGPEHPETLTAKSSLALSYRSAGRLDEALEIQEEVLLLSRKVSGPEHPDTLSAMNNLAMSYQDAGRLEEAIKMREKVLDLFRKVFGPEHPDTFKAMGNLAHSYLFASRLDEALAMGEEVLALFRKVSGPEHPDTLGAMNNLAMSYMDAGRLDEAIKMGEEVLTLRREVSGPEHTGTLRAMGNLAQYYHAVGRLDEAIKMSRKAVPLLRKVSGPEHPETLTAMQLQAQYYRAAGRPDEAVEMGEEVLALSRKKLGPEHPITLTAMNSLAHSYHAAGRLDEALEMGEEVLALYRKVSGPEHTGTISAMSNLAVFYQATDRQDEAFEMQKEVLAHLRKVLGPDHPTTLTAMNNLATSYHAAGRKDEAIEIQDEVLAQLRKVRGPEHPNTLLAMNNLAASYRQAGRPDEAIEMQKEVVAMSREVRGAEHPETLRVRQNLASFYHHAGRMDEAILLQEELLALRRKVSVPEHPDTLNAMHDLAASYAAAGRKDEAIEMDEEVLALRRKVGGPEHPDTLLLMNNLATFYYTAGRLDEAIVLGEEVVTRHRKVRGPEHPDTLAVMQNLSSFYTAAGRKDEANKLVEELLALRRKVPGSEPTNKPNAEGNVGKTGAARPVIGQSPLGFSLVDLAAKDEAGRSPLLGEPDLSISGESRDGKTGVDYDEERTYTVNDYTLDLLFLAGQLKQINLTTGFDESLKGIEAIRPFLGDAVKLSAPESATAPEFHPALFPNAGEGRVYMEFDEDGITDTFKLVLPERDAKHEGENSTNANESK